MGRRIALIMSGVVSDPKVRMTVTLTSRLFTGRFWQDREKEDAAVFLRLYGIDLSWTPSFYFTHLNCAIERNTVPCENP